MPQIDGKNYIKPGAYIPGGDPDVIYVARDTLPNIQLNLPAVDNQGKRARAIDINADVVSRLVGAGPAWDWQQDNPATAVLESFTLNVVAGPSSVSGNPAGDYSFRLPYAFNITDIRAYIYDSAFMSADMAVQVYKKTSLVAPAAPILFDPGSAPYAGLVIVKNAEFSSVTALSPIVFLPGENLCAEDDELTFEDIAGSGAKGLTITILGYRL